jgi:hypothetical protein
MSTIKISEDFDQPVSVQEAADNAAWFDQWWAQVEKDNAEEPLPDDVLDYMEGKKWSKA